MTTAGRASTASKARPSQTLWTLTGWNDRAAHAMWDTRIGAGNADMLAVDRLPAYRGLVAFVTALVVATIALVALPMPGTDVAVAAVVLAAGVVVVGRGVRPMRRAGEAMTERLRASGHQVDRPAPLNDTVLFDRWATRNHLDAETLTAAWS